MATRIQGRPEIEQLLYSINDASERLGISRSMLYTLIKSNTIRTVHIGKRIFIRTSDLDSYVASLGA
jgi:excisionase family DNA binding protein